ncbi:MAG TPA: glycosyltransferase family 39 protein [Solirubrobacteraceae bacterium]|jgi:4-amino-4-deoxy-L-arabinose transferase-like glycosyltransferase
MTTTELLHPLRHASTSAAPPAAARRSATDSTNSSTERVADPAWARPALIALLMLTALAYLWDLSASGYANSFYAAAVQAGTKSWKAFFFGSLDSSNFITVDKPPASLWVMELSGRIFGFSSASMLVPQALEGVAAVGLLYATVKRWFGAGAGLLAGVVFALTPVAALMFRFNNPDALLVLTLVASAYCLVRAIERAGTRWILAAGAMIGIAFLAKMMQAFLVLPAFAFVYMLASPTTLWRRLGQLLAGAGAMLISAGWWVAIVALWPAGSRPFIDGSSDNSILNLIVGYNGLGRIFAGSSGGPGGGGPGGGGGGANFSGATGPLRLFNELMGAQASWLLPAALLALAGGLWARRHAPRTDRVRAALLLWGGWLLVTAIVFSFGQGVIHTYYTVALAPAIGALVAIGAAMCWSRRERLAARLMSAIAIAASAGWAYALLERTPSWEPWLRLLILIAGALGASGLLLAPALGRTGKRVTAAAAVLGVVAAMTGPVAYAADTITTPHTGSIPSAGPASAAGPGGGAFGGAGRAGARGIGTRGIGSGTPPAGMSVAGGGAPGAGGSISGPGGSAPGAGSGTARQGGTTGSARAGSIVPPGSSASDVGGASAAAGGPPAAAGGSRGSAGGFAGQALTGSQSAIGVGGGPGGGGIATSAALVKALRVDAGNYRWAAATSGSQSAASLELASDEAVMGIGGFSGQGGNLSLAEFERYVAAGDIHYYIGSAAGGGGPGGGGSSSVIATWVKAHYTAQTIGGQTVYDLTQAKS